MKITEVASELEIRVLVEGDSERDVTQVITGDLLSFIMGTAPPGCLWLTVQNHLNVAAVAVLKEIPLIILTTGRQPSPELEEKCRIEDISLGYTAKTTFSVISDLARMGLNG